MWILRAISHKKRRKYMILENGGIIYVLLIKFFKTDLLTYEYRYFII